MCWQTYGQQSRLQKYCKAFRRQHIIDKFDSTIQQLDEHSETAWKLQDNDMILRRRGMRASFSKGPSIHTSSMSMDSIDPGDGSASGAAELAGGTTWVQLLVTWHIEHSSQLHQPTCHFPVVLRPHCEGLCAVCCGLAHAVRANVVAPYTGCANV